MTNTRAIGLVVWMLGLTVHVDAQDSAQEDSAAIVATDEQAESSVTATEVPPPPPADAPASQVPEPPAAYANADANVSANAATPQWSSGVHERDDGPDARRLFNIWLGLGIGDALGCGNEDPDSPCAVDFAGTVALAADYRFVPNFSIGLELASWGFAVSDGWRGQLPGEPDNAEISLGYLALFGRWYWFDQGILDPYVQLGLGVGSMTATVSNETDSYRYASAGVVPHLGAGIDFQVHRAVRIGPQLHTALLLGGKICEQVNDGKEICRDPEKNEKGEQEGNALAWRFMLVGTIMLGAR